MGIDQIRRRLAAIERAQDAEVAAQAGGAVLFLPSNGRELPQQGPRVRTYNAEKCQAARDAGADEHVAMELAMDF